MPRWILITATFLSVSAQCLSAQTLVSKLPADGTWAKYSISIEKSSANGESSEIDGELTIRVVGTETVNDNALRWIEIDQTLVFDEELAARYGVDQIRIADKLLVAESDIGESSDPVSNLRKMWRSNWDEPRFVEPNSATAKTLHTLLPAPMTKTRPLENKQVETTAGVLNCTGLAGMDRTSHPSGLESKRLVKTYSHDDSPFGTVMFKSISKTLHDAQWQRTRVATVRLKRTGTGAISLFPENN